MRACCCCCRRATAAPPPPPPLLLLPLPLQPPQPPQPLPQPPPPPPPASPDGPLLGTEALWTAYRDAVYPGPWLWLQPLSFAALWGARGRLRSLPAAVSSLLACVPLRTHFGALVSAFILLSLGGQLDGALSGVRATLTSVGAATDDPTVKFLLSFLSATSTSKWRFTLPCSLGCG